MSDESRSTNPASASSLGAYAPSVVTPKMLQLTEDDLDIIEHALDHAVDALKNAHWIVGTTEDARVDESGGSISVMRSLRVRCESMRVLMLKIQANR